MNGSKIHWSNKNEGEPHSPTRSVLAGSRGTEASNKITDNILLLGSMWKKKKAQGGTDKVSTGKMKEKTNFTKRYLSTFFKMSFENTKTD